MTKAPADDNSVDGVEGEVSIPVDAHTISGHIEPDLDGIERRERTRWTWGERLGRS